MTVETIRKLPGVKTSVETGAVQFGDDWPGLFIRGDNVFGYGLALKAALEGNFDPKCDPFSAALLEDLLRMMASAIVSPSREALLPARDVEVLRKSKAEAEAKAKGQADKSQPD